MCELNRQATTDKCRRRKLPGVNTMHKRVADKVRPVDSPRATEPSELGLENWKQLAIERQLLALSLRPPDIGPFDHLFEKRYAAFPRGTRLTPARFEQM
ncbi:hypothetical protein BKA63DRAFT_421736, partial [Paraphoma chrysanthemicola]